MFAITKWSQDQCRRDNVSKKRKKGKDTKKKKKKNLTTSLIYTPPITKISYTNPAPMYDYSHIKTTPHFCHK